MTSNKNICRYDFTCENKDNKVNCDYICIYTNLV